MKRRGSAGRYGALFLTLVLLLGFGASYTVAGLIGEARAERPLLVPLDGADTFAVRDPHLIRPAPGAISRYAEEDAAWRARHARPVLWQTMGDPVWHPSPRQLATDAAYRLVSAGRVAEAVPVLERWLVDHPRDYEIGFELARLLNSLGRTDEAIARYRLTLRSHPLASAHAELAGLLLSSEHYAEAAEEFGHLLARDRDNVSYRFGRARAFAWGNRSREAERELLWLATRLPGDTLVTQLLRSVRANIDPSPAEARRWVAGAPDWTPYRLALARALATAGQSGEAAAQFDTVIASGATVALLREAAGAHGTAGDSLGAARLFGRAVAMLPDDDSLLVDYARALAWSGDRDAAIREYGVLLARERTASRHLARGELYSLVGDLTSAEADLAASASLQPSYDALVQLGDVRRWRGEYRAARDAYQRALALRPGDPRTLAAMTALARDERLYYASVPDADTGWVARGSYAEDNAGFLFLAAGVARGFSLGERTTLSVGAEQRRVSQRAIGAPERYVYGWAAEGSLTRRLTTTVSATARAGVARHAMTAATPTGGISATWARSRAAVTAGVSQEMVYRSLMSLAAVAPTAQDMVSVRDTRPLTGRVASVSATIPAGLALVAMTAQRTALSDGNVRHEVNATVRVPITDHVAALYSGGEMGYSKRSALYWDPRRYRSHAVGVEVNMRGPIGTQVAVRALPGVGRADELVPGATPGTFVRLPSRNVMQIETGGEISWQRDNLSLSAELGYGRGREGGYQSLQGALRVRIGW